MAKLGPRSKDDVLNVEGSGYHYRDKVKVDNANAEVNGFVEAIHTGGKKIDVRIDQPGHENHGRIVTYSPDDVDPHPDFLRSLKGDKAAAAKD